MHLTTVDLSICSRFFAHIMSLNDRIVGGQFALLTGWLLMFGPYVSGKTSELKSGGDVIIQ